MSAPTKRPRSISARAGEFRRGVPPPQLRSGALTEARSAPLIVRCSRDIAAGAAGAPSPADRRSASIAALTPSGGSGKRSPARRDLVLPLLAWRLRGEGQPDGELAALARPGAGS